MEEGKGERQTLKRNIMAKKKPIPERSPSKPPKGPGGGGAARVGGDSPDMDSGGGKNSAMACDVAAECKSEAGELNPVLARVERSFLEMSGIGHNFLRDFHEIRRRRGEYASTADVDALGMNVFRSVSKLMYLANTAHDDDARLHAGRILADVVNVWLDRWPDNALNCVTAELIHLKENVHGFQMRWNEINRRGIPRQRGFAKNGESERTGNEDLLSDYIWDIQRAANAPMGLVVAQLIRGERKAPASWDNRVKRWWKFVQNAAVRSPMYGLGQLDKGKSSNADLAGIFVHLNDLHAKRIKTAQGWKAFCLDKFGGNDKVVNIWLDQAINDHFDSYWSIVIEPGIERAHYLSWARTRPFQRESDVGKIVRGIKGNSSRSSPAYPPFADAKRKMKPMLLEIMHPSFRPEFVW